VEATYNEKRVDDFGLDPLSAFARLRSYTPGRACFLLESTAHDDDAGRYSVVGYRAMQCEMVPPGIDPVVTQAAQLEPLARPDSLALALAQAAVGWISYGALAFAHGVKPSDDEGASAGFIVGSTIALFDHHDDHVTVAGKVKGKRVERLIWEAQHGPEVDPLGEVSDELPEQLRTLMQDEKLAAKAARAQPFLEEDVEDLLLAHTFMSPLGGADAFDVYRALRAIAPMPHMFFIDMGESPVAPRVQLIGGSRHAVYVHRRGQGEPASASRMKEALPHPSTIGSGGPMGAKLIRRVEDNARQIYGGAAGYLCPGGEAAFSLAEQVVVAQHGNFEHAVPVPFTAESDVTTLADQARGAATTGLRAIRYAQARAAAAESS
jgi:anthranilate synthase component 1